MEGSFVFYGSWMNAVKRMPDDLKVEAYEAIMEYGCMGEIDLDSLNPWVASVLETIIPQIEANRKRRSDGAKGGRPKTEKPVVSEEKTSGFETENQRLEDEKPLAERFSDAKPNVYVNVNDNVNDNVYVDVNADDHVKPKKRFTPPSVGEVAAYCAERGNGIDAEEFCAYYGQQGWKLSNGNSMKDWKSSVITWEKSRKKGAGKQPSKNPFLDYTHKTNYDLDALERQLTENPRLISNG